MADTKRGEPVELALRLELRDYFAGQAMAGLLAKGTEGRFSSAAGVNRAAVWAYEYADAMIAARERD